MLKVNSIENNNFNRSHKIMFDKKLKLSPDHKLLIKELEKELDCSFEQTGEFVMEFGFVFLRLLSEEPNKLIEAKKIMNEDEFFSKAVKWMRECWEVRSSAYHRPTKTTESDEKERLE